MQHGFLHINFMMAPNSKLFFANDLHSRQSLKCGNLTRVKLKFLNMSYFHIWSTVCMEAINFGLAIDSLQIKCWLGDCIETFMKYRHISCIV